MRKLRILIADDHELVRQGIRRLFRARSGWRVVAEAVTGRDAVEKAAKLKPDVVIMDIGMPEMDGLQATRQIRDSDRGIQIVVLTMHESDQMIRRVMDAGACSYVSKSDFAKNLVNAVRDAAEGKPFITPRVTEIVLEGVRNPGTTPQGREQIIGKLTPREIEVIRLLVHGRANKEIAATLAIAVRTVETHRARIMLKLSVHSISELIHFAIQHEILLH